ncbi:hypothetical protein [Limnobacter sp.]|uniref:hypothetical protein n=1 Tax=Limnobacter sp. TaxID=2003368 RepID=UPI0039C9BEE4
MAHLEHSATTLQNPVTTPQQIQTLQVFNGGKPCGWLGQTATGFWFHYASNNPKQHWVSLLMPPRINFYQQAELFPVFSQHLGAPAGSEADALSQLHQLNGQQLGSLSFANPDNPVVTPPLRTPPRLAAGQRALIANPNTPLVRRPFADTLVHHSSTWPWVQTLQQLKKQGDPNNRLQALRWALQAQHNGEWVQHPRPDLAPYQQHLYGFEAVHAVLKQNPQQFQTLAENSNRFAQVLHEVARTYCKNFSAEIELLQKLLPFISRGQLQASLVYQQQAARTSRPIVLGLEYLPLK